MIKGLYAIVGSHANFSPSKMAEICLEGGASVIQLRMKNSKKEDILKEGKKICDLKKKYSFIFIVNDDPKIALELDADGVHLGQRDLSFEAARKILGSDKIIGVSTHSLKQAENWCVSALVRSCASMNSPSHHRTNALTHYIALGAIFKSLTKNKKDHPVVGTELLKQVVGLSPIPVVAIGGIGRNNIDEVVKTGVHSVALISALDREGQLIIEKEIQEEVRFFATKFL